MWPKRPDRLSTARGRAWVKRQLAAAEGLASPMTLTPAGLETAIRVRRLSQMFGDVLQSEATAAAREAAARNAGNG